MLLQEFTTLTQQYKIFVDLDGVVSDFSGGIKKLGLDHSEDRYESEPLFRKQMWDAVTYYQQQGGELWYDLNLLPDAMELWSYVSKYEPEILSATGDPKYGGGEQKRKWVAKHFGSHIKVNLVQSAEDKAKFSGHNKILIDDKPKAINPWRAAGGIGILHTTAAKTIAELQKLNI